MKKTPQQPIIDLLYGEDIEFLAKPHPLSFLNYHVFTVYLIGVAIFLGWFYFYLRSNGPLLESLGFLNSIFGVTGIGTADAILFTLFWVILLLSGFSIGVLWISKMPLIYMVLVGAAGTALEYYFLTPYEMILIPKPLVKVLLLGVIAFIGIFLIEVYRRGHTYVITNYRIITKKGFLRIEERELTYDKISDVYVNQGILGRLFNFGTVIPISSSGFGLGEDSAQAITGAALPVKHTMIGGGFGGERSVHKPRASTFFSLYGITNPRKIRIFIANRQMESKETPVLQRIENLLKDKTDKGHGLNEI